MPGGHFLGSAAASRGEGAASWSYFLETAVKTKFREQSFHEAERIRPRRESCAEGPGPYRALHFLPLLLGRMHFVPEDPLLRGVWRSLPQGTPDAGEHRLIYLEFELERRILAHERVLRKILWDLGIPMSGHPTPLEGSTAHQAHPPNVPKRR